MAWPDNLIVDTIEILRTHKSAGCQDPILSYFILFFLAKSYFVLFFGKCPILSYFLAILPLILVFYSVFITLISHENIL